MTDLRHAQATLAGIDDVRRRTRADLEEFWFPLVLFGSLTLLSLPVAGLGDGLGAAVFWGVAGPAGAVAVALHYKRRELALGATRCATPYLLTAGGLMVGSFLLPALTSEAVQPVASAFAIAAGYMVFARLERSGALAALSAVMVLAAGVAIASGHDLAYLAAWATIGGAVLGTGLALRRRQAR